MAADWSGRRLNVKACSPISDTIVAGQTSYGEKAAFRRRRIITPAAGEYAGVQLTRQPFSPLLLLFVQFGWGESSGILNTHLNGSRRLSAIAIFELVTINVDGFAAGR